MQAKGDGSDARFDLLEREKMRGREKEMRGGRKREERCEGDAAADGTWSPGGSAAGSSSFTPCWSRDASVQPSRPQLLVAGPLRGAEGRGRELAGAAGERIWRPLPPRGTLFLF
ncbi:hypothetical protein ACQJBY_059979 [Aegilops geniculata]